ncbi:glutamate cyclase domain-containing protein [Parahaliea mediterranea]|uniref:glutamate cyclase domain-containing protein n=1 Tax=Parahaliea mediterranea TaxID=651086 RepID=UPI000E2FD1DA|nr:glutamate cyclase domain-containing protein [Parahaliea mediterranea]
MNEQDLSVAIENALVARNLRQMRVAQAALQPGYYLRAARLLQQAGTARAGARVLIGTGFPVVDTFETDGPVGAIALYEALAALGYQPTLACAAPLAAALAPDFAVLELTGSDLEGARHQARDALTALQPAAVVSIERPGLAADGRYYNMRGEDISARCGIFDPFMELADCPTIAIGDGGNEIGMGNIASAISALDIRVSVTTCDELLVADVSNWGAYGLIAFLGMWRGRDLLGAVSPIAILDYLSQRGSVDGVTRENTPTEDGLDAAEGLAVLAQLRALTGFADR